MNYEVNRAAAISAARDMIMKLRRNGGEEKFRCGSHPARRGQRAARETETRAKTEEWNTITNRRTRRNGEAMARSTCYC